MGCIFIFYLIDIRNKCYIYNNSWEQESLIMKSKSEANIENKTMRIYWNSIALYIASKISFLLASYSSWVMRS